MRWESGLPMLAKGSDVVLESLAVKELAAPTAVEDVMKLADAWWDVGVPAVSARESVRQAAAEQAEGRKRQRVGV